MEYAIVAAMALVLLAGALGWGARGPSVTLAEERAAIADRRAAAAEAAMVVLAAAEKERRTGAQADADHDAELRAALVAAPPDDPLAAALAVVHVGRARDAARAAAADPAGGATGDVGAGGDVAPGGAVGPDPPGARA